MKWMAKTAQEIENKCTKKCGPEEGSHVDGGCRTCPGKRQNSCRGSSAWCEIKKYTNFECKQRCAGNVNWYVHCVLWIQEGKWSTTCIDNSAAKCGRKVLSITKQNCGNGAVVILGAFVRASSTRDWAVQCGCCDLSIHDIVSFN